MSSRRRVGLRQAAVRLQSLSLLARRLRGPRGLLGALWSPPPSSRRLLGGRLQAPSGRPDGQVISGTAAAAADEALQRTVAASSNELTLQRGTTHDRAHGHAR